MTEEIVKEVVNEVANEGNVVTSETAKTSVEYVSRDLDDSELIEKKLQLMQSEIHKDKTDISLEEMEKQLTSKIPERFLDDDIKAVKEDIANKTKKNEKGDKIPATDSDLEYMNIRLQSLEKSKELDIPMRELRFAIQELRYKKNRFDAPEKQIKKLQKEIRERKETTLASRTPQYPIGVN